MALEGGLQGGGVSLADFPDQVICALLVFSRLGKHGRKASAIPKCKDPNGLRTA
jgi:hypothetical protein